MALDFSNDVDIIQIAVPGIQGPPGKVAVGSVTTGAAGTNVSVTVVRNAQGEDVLSFTIPRGSNGPSNVLNIGTVTTGAAGASAAASLTGTSPTQTLNLTIPQGLKGDKGDQGNPGTPGTTGPANTLSIGTVTTVAAGSQANATITGTAPNQTLNLTIPQGAQGNPGIQGVQGNPGTNASLSIGTVTTGAAGTAASATITGSAPNQVLNLTIPQGQAGSGSTIGDANNTTKGILMLSGDLGGNATSPIVVNGANHTHTAAQVSDSSSIGRSVLTAATAAAARTAIGAGTGNSNLAIGTTAGTAADGGTFTSHTNATVTHGATGAIVGTTNTQTLTNKTLTNPAIGEYFDMPDNPTVPGSPAAGVARMYVEPISKKLTVKDSLGLTTRYTAHLGTWTAATTVNGYSGDTYTIQETNTTYMRSNDKWIHQGDSGWITVTSFATGFTGITTANENTQYRLLNGWISLNVHVQRDSASRTGSLFTLPTGYRPGRVHWTFLSNGGRVGGELKVNVNGDVVWFGDQIDDLTAVATIDFPVA